MTDDRLRPGQKWHLSLTSDTENLAGLRETVARAAVCVGFEEPEVSQIMLAVDEAIANVIKHGYGGRSGQPIEVRMACARHRERPALEVTIEDRGRQVDPCTIVGRELADVRPGGLGTHIIRNVMDEVEYSMRDSGGMCLRMVKACGPCPDQTASENKAEGTANG